MAERNWNTIFGGIQAASAVAVAGLAFWAFFFSSLSQRLEDSLRTEATLAKQELVAARDEKSRLATETVKLTDARTQLKAELASLEEKISVAATERAAYAQSTKELAHARYYVMAKYELATVRKIAEICADYGLHRKWLATRREIASLEKQRDALPLAQRHDSKLPINKRLSELEEARYSTLDLWFGMPLPPSIMPAGEDRIVITAHDLKTMRDENHEKQNSYLVSWLLDRIAQPKGVQPQTGTLFIEQTKKYAFLDQLLPKERDEFNSKIDSFMSANDRFRAVQLNVTVGSENPTPNDIVAAGKRTLGGIKEFQHAFLVHLHNVGIAEAGKKEQ